MDGNVQSKPSTKFENKKNRVYRLLEATYYALVSRSELVCYFLMILNQILYCSLLSLPLPLMVFLWGMLSVPRPSKMFWITAITYTEVQIKRGLRTILHMICMSWVVLGVRIFVYFHDQFHIAKNKTP